MIKRIWNFLSNEICYYFLKNIFTNSSGICVFCIKFSKNTTLWAKNNIDKIFIILRGIHFNVKSNRIVYHMYVFLYIQTFLLIIFFWFSLDSSFYIFDSSTINQLSTQNFINVKSFYNWIILHSYLLKIKNVA